MTRRGSTWNVGAESAGTRAAKTSGARTEGAAEKMRIGRDQRRSSCATSRRERTTEQRAVAPPPETPSIECAVPSAPGRAAVPAAHAVGHQQHRQRRSPARPAVTGAPSGWIGWRRGNQARFSHLDSLSLSAPGAPRYRQRLATGNADCVPGSTTGRTRAARLDRFAEVRQSMAGLRGTPARFSDLDGSAGSTWNVGAESAGARAAKTSGSTTDGAAERMRIGPTSGARSARRPRRLRTTEQSHRVADGRDTEPRPVSPISMARQCSTWNVGAEAAGYRGAWTSGSRTDGSAERMKTGPTGGPDLRDVPPRARHRAETP